jgi:hypothetical protein
MSAIRVTVTPSNLTFPNFPHVCEEIQTLASQMGVTRDIQIREDSSVVVRVEGISKPSNVATLLLPREFPASRPDALPVPTEFLLRHELAHILYDDDSAQRYWKYVYLFAFAIGASVGMATDYALLQTGNTFIPLATMTVGPFITNAVFKSIVGGTSACQLREKRADEKACRGLSAGEKIKAMRWLKQTSQYERGDMVLWVVPDMHPSNRERIQTIWETFTEQQKAQHEELKKEFLL